MLFGLINLMNSVAFAKVIYSFVLTYFFLSQLLEKEMLEKRMFSIRLHLFKNKNNKPNVRAEYNSYLPPINERQVKPLECGL